MSDYYNYESYNTLADLGIPSFPQGHPLAVVCSNSFAAQFGGDDALLGAHVHDAIEAYVSSQPPQVPTASTTGRSVGACVIPPALRGPAHFMSEAQLGARNRSYAVRGTGPRTAVSSQATAPNSPLAALDAHFPTATPDVSPSPPSPTEEVLPTTTAEVIDYGGLKSLHELTSKPNHRQTAVALVKKAAKQVTSCWGTRIKEEHHERDEID